MSIDLTLDQLKHQLAMRRVTLTTSNGKLIADDPTQRLTPMLDRAIRQHRMALLSGGGTEFPELLYAVKRAVVVTDLEDLVIKADAAYAAATITVEELESLVALATERACDVPYSIEDMPLSQFAGSGLVRKIHSRVLDEVVLFAADNAEICVANSLVVYRAKELRKLVGMPPDQLRAVHAVKKVLDGEVIEASADLEIPIEALLKSRTRNVSRDSIDEAGLHDDQ